MNFFYKIWQLILLKMILKIVNVILLLSTPKKSLPQLWFIWLKLVSWFKRRVYKVDNKKINDDDCQISIRKARLNLWIRWAKRPRDLLFIRWQIFVVTWLNSTSVTRPITHAYSDITWFKPLQLLKRTIRQGHLRSPDLLSYVTLQLMFSPYMVNTTSEKKQH